jgi:hypothetical protein
VGRRSAAESSLCASRRKSEHMRRLPVGNMWAMSDDRGQISLDPETLAALKEFTTTLQSFLERLEAQKKHPASPVVGRLDLLWKRLGGPNRRFLFECANELGTREFTIEDMAEASGESEATVRARLRNLGRSLKSLGANAPLLWDSDWDGEQMVYTWDPETREALLAKAAR